MLSRETGVEVSLTQSETTAPLPQCSPNLLRKHLVTVVTVIPSHVYMWLLICLRLFLLVKI